MSIRIPILRLRLGPKGELSGLKAIVTNSDSSTQETVNLWESLSVVERVKLGMVYSVLVHRVERIRQEKKQ